MARKILFLILSFGLLFQQSGFSYAAGELNLPNDTFWVNLRPDAADNIIDLLLEKTDIGKTFLEQVYDIIRSIRTQIYPEGIIGQV